MNKELRIPKQDMRLIMTSKYSPMGILVSVPETSEKLPAIRGSLTMKKFPSSL
jgi:hypothetical protein